ncbi:unnamed protein product, partial [Strongylus vulgaris]
VSCFLPKCIRAFRVLALDYGADLAYTEEIIDQKLLTSKRIVNSGLFEQDFISDVLDTIDYCMVDDIVLRISKAREQQRCVLQIGTNNGSSAAEVAKMIGTDVSAIDVNMGCPKPFSIHCGMGSALLAKVDKIKEVSMHIPAVQNPLYCVGKALILIILMRYWYLLHGTAPSPSTTIKRAKTRPREEEAARKTKRLVVSRPHGSAMPCITSCPFPSFFSFLICLLSLFISVTHLTGLYICNLMM